MGEQEKTRPAALDGWLHLVNDDLDGARQRLPETLTDADLEYWAARGWHPVEAVDEGTAPGVPAPADTDPGAPEWVELVHPLTGARHSFPNNPAAVAGAGEAGWVEPNKDGSVPKRAARRAAKDAGVDVDELPDPDDDPDPGGTATRTTSPAPVRGSRMSGADGAGKPDQNDQPAESSATDQKE